MTRWVSDVFTQAKFIGPFKFEAATNERGYELSCPALLLFIRLYDLIYVILNLCIGSVMDNFKACNDTNVTSVIIASIGSIGILKLQLGALNS